MPDKHSNDRVHRTMDDSLDEGNVLKNNSDTANDFDHLQERFDALEAQPHPSQSSHPKKPSDQNPESEDHEQTSNAFNDLVNAFAIESAPSSSAEEADSNDGAMSEKKRVPALNEALPKFHPSSTPIEFDARDFDLSHLHEDIDPATDETIIFPASVDKSTPASDEHEFDLDSNALFENETPVYADLSAEKDNNQHSKNKIIAFASALLLTIAGGVYWYSSDTAEQRTASSHHNASPVLEQRKTATADPSTSLQIAQPAQQNDSTSSMATATTSPTPPVQSAHTKQKNYNDTASQHVNAATNNQIAIHQPVNAPLAHHQPSTTRLTTTDQVIVTTQLAIIKPLASESTTPTQQISNTPATPLQPETTQLIIVDAEPLTSRHASATKPVQSTNDTLILSQDIVASIEPSPTLTPTPVIKSKTPETRTPAHASSAQRLVVQPIALSTSAGKHTPKKAIAVDKNKNQPTSSPKLALVQPSTPIHYANKPAATASSITNEAWAVLAPVASNKAARQYIARFKAQHLDSSIIRLQGNGQVRHFIQIKGFSSQQAAEKQRDVLINSLGFNDVNVNQL